jgi:cyclic pyranopterin phosphate synthase
VIARIQHGLTHLDATGAARMVDISEKRETHRTAVASSFVEMALETVEMIVTGTAPKGDVLATARVAGIMASKRTSELIPMCHPLAITHASIHLAAELSPRPGIRVTATLETDGRTGIEMEALTAAAVAGLTLYDMCKAVDRGMIIRDLMLLRKEGGQSGVWMREEPRS